MTRPVSPQSTATHCHPQASSLEYIRHVKLAIMAGRSIIAPTTIAQIEALIEYSPALGRGYIPQRRYLEFYGLPPSWGQEPIPFSDTWCERFYATLESNDTFCRAVALKLGVR